MTDEEFMVSVIKHLQYISKQLGFIEQNTNNMQNSLSCIESDVSILSTIEEEVTDILISMPADRERIPEKKPPQKKKKGSK